MLIFFPAGDSYFYFELCTKCLFTPEKVLPGCPASGLTPPRQPFSPCVVAFYFYFVAMVAAASAAAFGCCLFYGTDDYVLSGVWGP